MGKDAALFIKIAEDYLEDVDLCLRKAASHGYMGLDYTEEKLAAFKRLLLNLDSEAIDELDKTAMEELNAMEKAAVWGAIARGAVGLGSKVIGGLGRGAQAVAARGAQFAKGPAPTPSRNWMTFMTGKYGPEKAKAMAADFTAAGGAKGWMAQRKATLAAGRAAAPAAGVQSRALIPYTGGQMVPHTGGQAGAAAGGNGRMKEIWKQTKSGLLWGGGFGLANRLMSPAEEPEYRFVGNN